MILQDLVYLFQKIQSSYIAELQAIEYVLYHIKINDNIVICTDSSSSIEAIENSKNNTERDWRLNKYAHTLKSIYNKI